MKQSMTLQSARRRGQRNSSRAVPHCVLESFACNILVSTLEQKCQAVGLEGGKTEGGGEEGPRRDEATCCVALQAPHYTLRVAICLQVLMLLPDTQHPDLHSPCHGDGSWVSDYILLLMR